MTPLERDRRKAGFTKWCEIHVARLATLPAEVRTEVENVTLSRFMDGSHRAMTAAELDDCRARVASRLRIQRYGRLPDDVEEARRQIDECRALCGLNPKPPVRGRVPAQAAE